MPPLWTPAPASYYASGWHSIGDTSGGEVVGGAFCPAPTASRMTYKRHPRAAELESTSSAPTPLSSRPVKSSSDSGNATGLLRIRLAALHASGDELLPGSYTFKFSDQGNTHRSRSPPEW